jgi:hypothetical protein
MAKKLNLILTETLRLIIAVIKVQLLDLFSSQNSQGTGQLREAFAKESLGELQLALS